MSNFLAPDDDYTNIADFCKVKVSTGLDFRGAVDAAADDVVKKCGPVLRETVTHTIRIRAAEQVLPARPSAILTFTPTGGTAQPSTDFDFDGQVLSRVDGQQIPPGVVTFTSGWDSLSIPPALLFAGSLLARHLWRSQLGNQHTPDADLSIGTAWLWPAQAKELARPYMLAPLVFA